MTLHIKNMVCDRCIMVVRQQLENHKLEISKISLGTAEVYPEPDQTQLEQLGGQLRLLGFELIDKEKERLVERIKNIVIELVHHANLSEENKNLHAIIADRLHKDYAYLSRLFSDAQDITLEKFIIQQKVEKVKELLDYDEYNIKEIAYRLGYSSSAHLSAQFKNVTGLTPKQYKTSETVQRKAIDMI